MRTIFACFTDEPFIAVPASAGRYKIPNNNTARMGPMEHSAIKPKLSLEEFLSSLDKAIPNPNAIIKGTVVTPPESKDTGTKLAGAKIFSAKSHHKTPTTGYADGSQTGLAMRPVPEMHQCQFPRLSHRDHGHIHTQCENAHSDHQQHCSKQEQHQCSRLQRSNCNAQ